MRYSRGFTLIELMVTIAVLAIVVSIAAPSFSKMLQDNRVLSVSSELQGALQLSRSEAVKRGQNVTLCRRDDAGTACADGTDWGNGWVILGGTANTLIKSWDGAADLAIAGPSSGITFQPNGMATPETFSVKHASSCTGKEKRTLEVKRTGTTTLDKVNC